MATFNLMNSVVVRGLQLFAGDLIDDTVDSTADISAAGGVLIATGNATLDAAALKCRTQRKYRSIDEKACDQIMGAAFDAAAGKAVGMQSGRATLASGTVTVAGVVLTAASRIFLQMADPGSGAITGFVEFTTPDASRNVGAGSFVINAVDAAKAVVATMNSTVDYLIVG